MKTEFSDKEDRIEMLAEVKRQFPRKFSSMQERILQRRLHAFSSIYGYRNKLLAEEIAEHTGVEVGTEAIRMFIKRLDFQPGKGESKTTSLKTQQAIASFLMYDEFELLTFECLQQRKIGGAPMGFIDGLKYGLDDESPTLHKSYQGLYWANLIEDEEQYIALLEFDIPKDIPFYNLKVVLLRSDALLQKTMGKKKRVDKIRFDGWGVMTPENGIFMHVKELTHGGNSLWNSAASPADFAGERSTNHLFLYRQAEAPILNGSDDQRLKWESDFGSQIANNCVSNMRDNIVQLQLIRSNVGEIHNEYDIVDLDRISADIEDVFNSDLANSPFSKNYRFLQPQNVLQDEVIEIREVKVQEHSQEYLGQMLIRAVNKLSEKSVKELLDQGAPVNYQHRYSGATALIYAATYGSREIVRLLMKQPDLDYLIEDKRGRTASFLAYVADPIDAAMCRLLFYKEGKQMEQEKLLPTPNDDLDGGPSFDPM